MSEGVSTPMPKYRCHKEVWALKIKAVNLRGDGNGLLDFEDPRYAARGVTADFIFKHGPKAGGYFVVYKDGYESFSPAEAFEEGYAPV